MVSINPKGSVLTVSRKVNLTLLKKLVTDQLWSQHLAGEGPSLGIIPIMADNTSRWGCIDIDTYPIDYRKIINSIRTLQLPLVPCRSKSGGLHIFLVS